MNWLTLKLGLATGKSSIIVLKRLTLLLLIWKKKEKKRKTSISLTLAFWTSPCQLQRTAPQSSGSPSSPPCGLPSACRCSSQPRTGPVSRRSPLWGASRRWTPSSGWWRCAEPGSTGRRCGTWRRSWRRAESKSWASPRSSSCVKGGETCDAEREVLAKGTEHGSHARRLSSWS